MSIDWSQLACAVCGSALKSEILRVTQPDRFERHVGINELGYARSWVECGSCGAVTDVHLPQNRERLDALAAGYYEVDFANSSIADKFSKVMALPAQLSDNAQRVERIHAFMSGWLPDYVSEGRVLDIGAGTGVFLSRFLDQAQGRRWHANAVEPDPVAAAHLRRLERFPVIEALFVPELDLVDFDLVTLNKIVEHVPDPIKLVKGAASALRHGLGVLYLELPDKLTIANRPPSDNILGALHCHLYDPISIGVLLQKSGFAILRIERLFEPSGKITVTAFATLDAGVDRLANTQVPS